jgi:hypothetical protein
MDLYESLQQQAMLAVVDPDDDAWLRRIFRFYSKHFATPLHLVPQLPLEDVLRAYFEELFASFDEEDREERIEWLLMTPEERLDSQDSEKTLDARDDAFLANLNAEVASGETIKRPKEQKRQLVGTEEKPLPEGMKKLAAHVQRVKNRAAKLAGVSLPGPKPAAPPKPAEPKPPETLGELPEIRMDFGKAASGNLGSTSWGDLDPLAPPKRPKKT